MDLNDPGAAAAMTALLGNSDGLDPAPDADAQPQPDASAAPATPSAEERIAMLEEQLLEADERIRGLSDSRTEALNARNLAQALIEANNEQRRRWQEEQEAVRASAPPQWSEDEKARIVADPDLLYQKVMEAVAFGHKAAVSQLAPRIRAGEIVHGLSQKLVDAVADWALDRAKNLVASQGLDPSDLEREDLLQATYRTMQEAAAQSPDPQLAYTNMTLDPRAIAAAAMMSRTRLAGGPPIANRRQPAPTVGTGEHADRRPPPRKPEIISRMERQFGHKFTDAELKAAAEKAKRYDEVL